MKLGNRKRFFSIYYRNIFSMLLLVISAILVIAVTTLHQVSRFTRQQEEKIWCERIDQTKRTMDDLVGNFQDLSASASHNRLLRPYQLRKMNHIALCNAKEEIKKYSASFSNLHFLFFYMDDSNYVVYNEGIVDREDFGKSIYNFHNLSYSDLWAVLDDTTVTKIRLFPEDALTFQAQRYKKDVLPIFIPISTDGYTAYASLLVALDADYVRAELQYNWEDEAVVLLNSDNEILLTTRDLSEKEQEALDISLGQGMDERTLVRDPSTDMMLMCATSSTQALKCLVVNPQSNFSDAVTLLSGRISIIILAFFWLFLCAALAIAYYNYLPVKDLLLSVGIKVDRRMLRNTSERKLIQDAIQTLNSQVTQVESKYVVSNLYVKESLIHRLLVHEYQDSPLMREKCETYDIRLISPFCPVILLLPEKISPGEVSVFLNEMGKQDDQTGYFTADIGENMVCGLLTMISAESVGERICKIHKTVAEELRDYSICLCYGQLTESIEDLSASFQELFVALSVGHISYTGQALSIEELKNSSDIKPTLSSSSFPLLWDLETAALQKDISLLENATAKIVSYIQKTESPSYLIRGLVLEAAFILMRELKRSKTSKPDCEEWNPFHSPAWMSSRKQMAEGLEELSRTLAKYYLRTAHANEKIWSETVLEYVSSHYKDHDFSILTVSSQFEMSVTAFSSKFRSAVGTNFLSYINTLKIGWAKELLTTDLTLQEITDTLHYANPSNFNRMFKNATGITPAVFRNSHRREDDRTS